MKIIEGIYRLWQEDFFITHRTPLEVKKGLNERFGMNPSNVTMNLKYCKDFLRKESPGWIQKIRHGLIENRNSVSISVELQDITTDNGLLDACKINYGGRRYSDMVFNAFRHLEVRVRFKAKLDASNYGADLMETVFKPKVGILKIPTCETPAEEDGFKQIVKGMMMFHRNAKGHREQELDKNLALKIVGYIDYLLKIIETAEIRNNTP